MDSDGSYIEKPFDRKLASDFIQQSRHMYYMMGLAEMDVTKALQIIRNYKEKTGESLSFSGWVAHCVAQAVAENPEVIAMRKRRKTIIFKNPDITIPIEREIDGKKVPSVLIIREANKKTLKEIHNIIRKAQTDTSKERSTGISRKKIDFLLSLPGFVRDFLIWRRVRNDPFFKRKMQGTVYVVPVGMFGKDTPYWGINLGWLPLNIIIGSIIKRPKIIEGELENRDVLCITIKMDHIMVDGAPGTRFGKRLVTLIEDAFGLEDFQNI